MCVFSQPRLSKKYYFCIIVMCHQCVAKVSPFGRHWTHYDFLMNKMKEKKLDKNINKFRGKAFVLTIHGQKKKDLVQLKKFFNGTFVRSDDKSSAVPKVTKAVVSKEFGRNKIHPHWQGYFGLAERASMKDFMTDLLGHEGYHLEVAKGNETANVRYVYGVDKSYEIGWIVYKKNIKAPWDYQSQPYKFWKNFKLRGWQSELLPMLIKDDVDRREIIYIWDSEGNTGKTIMSEYLHTFHAAIITGGKERDMKYAITRWEEITSKYPAIIIVDICRSEDEHDFTGIESIKNGLFFSGKYESAMLHSVKKPNVVVFSNFPPKVENLSLDRWKIGNIKDGKIVWK